MVIKPYWTAPKTWSPTCTCDLYNLYGDQAYNRSNRRTYLRSCSKDGLIAVNISIAHISCEFGDLKESPSLGESSHMTFSRMDKYSSLTVLHIFRTTAKSYRDLSFVCISPEVYVQSGERCKNMFCS